MAKRFSGAAALTDVSFTVERTEILGIIGPNDAGKTTLLSLSAAFQEAASGRVSFGGRDLKRLRADQISRFGIARTFELTQAIPFLTVAEVVLLAASTRLPNDAAAGRAGAILGT